jgi:hypothetical protein
MEDDRELRTALERSGHGIGAEDFVEELERELRSRKSGTGRDRDVDYPDARVATERIDKAVAEEFGTTVVALRAHISGGQSGAETCKVA